MKAGKSFGRELKGVFRAKLHDSVYAGITDSAGIEGWTRVNGTVGNLQTTVLRNAAEDSLIEAVIKSYWAGVGGSLRHAIKTAIANRLEKAVFDQLSYGLWRKSWTWAAHEAGGNMTLLLGAAIERSVS